MNAVNTSTEKKYNNYYLNEDSKWREICSQFKAKMIIKACDGLKIKKILEIGAGDGSVLKSLNDLNFEANYYALEISNSGLNEIKKKKIDRLKEAESFDGKKSKYIDNEFDLVILSHVVEHVEYPREVISEAKRLGKMLYLEVPCEDNIRLSYNYKPDKTGHINFYSPKTFKRLLQTCGLNVEKENLYNPSLESYRYSSGFKGAISFFIKSFLLRINKKFASKIFTYHYGVLCGNTNDY
tara:strand:+ start:2628 stop:3344 length:717 start_codon:yes stop_codon:yes gene_type:complete